MPRTLPLELQHYVLKLALPSTKLFTGPVRRKLLKTFSLVHRSWTPFAQRLLFSELTSGYKTARDEARLTELLRMTLSKTKQVRRVEISMESLSPLLEERLGYTLARCVGVEEGSVVMGMYRSLPLAEVWPSSLRSLTIAERGAKPTRLPDLHYALPITLTRLAFSTIQGIVDLPAIPTLETLILTRTTVLLSGSKLGDLLPSLRIFAWDNAASSPPSFTLPTFSTAIKHMRLKFGSALTLNDAIELVSKLPTGRRHSTSTLSLPPSTSSSSSPTS